MEVYHIHLAIGFATTILATIFLLARPILANIVAIGLALFGMIAVANASVALLVFCDNTTCDAGTLLIAKTSSSYVYFPLAIALVHVIVVIAKAFYMIRGERV